MPGPTAVRRIVDWLRAGYPAGVPQQDYVALLALLRRKLTEAEVREVADRVILAHPDGNPSVASVEEQIASVLSEEPHESDVARVSARLAAVGWPLADIDD